MLAITVQPTPKTVVALNTETHIKKPTTQTAVTEPVATEVATPQVPEQPEVAPVTVAATPPEPTVGCGDDPYLAYIYQHESGCCPTKWQGEYGECQPYHGVPADDSGLGYGLCQATPPSKMAVVGADWTTSWDTQNAWCVSYALSRYGNSYNAYQYWLTNHRW